MSAAPQNQVTDYSLSEAGKPSRSGGPRALRRLMREVMCRAALRGEGASQ